MLLFAKIDEVLAFRTKVLTVFKQIMLLVKKFCFQFEKNMILCYYYHSLFNILNFIYPLIFWIGEYFYTL